MVADACGARVPCLIWVLEPVGFGDVMMDGVVPAPSGAAARSVQDLRPIVRGDTGFWEPAARHQLKLGRGAPPHCSGDLFEGGVAESSQNVVDPTRQFASDRQVGSLATETFFDLKVVGVVGGAGA